ncbi:MAG: hypothetical protein RR428_00675 [Coprobacillus sp.]
MIKKLSYQCWIGIGLLLGSMTYLAYEVGFISHSIKLGLLVLVIVFEMFGLMKFKRS